MTKLEKPPHRKDVLVKGDVSIVADVRDRLARRSREPDRRLILSGHIDFGFARIGRMERPKFDILGILKPENDTLIYYRGPIEKREFEYAGRFTVVDER